MKIENSNICLKSEHSSVTFKQKQENLQFWTGENPEASANSPPGIIIDISKKAMELHQQISSSNARCIDEDVEEALSEEDKQKLALIEAMLEQLLGKKIKFKIPRKIRVNNDLPNSQGVPANNGWGLIYDSKATYYESEKVSFSSTGMVRTSDGREIKIDLQLNMSREFFSSEEIHIRAGDAIRKDPLVINFDAPTAMLADNKFSFDIDCDGSPDQISRLMAGSGFLSLDLNNDGKINDGSELFGPQSGDGFSDLSLYDSDKNGWIDENDMIFDRLRIWTKDEYGNDTLFALGEKGIGAIYLGSAGTFFSLRGEGNEENGVIRKTGIFLRENGTVGSVQHVDLVI
ncbi:MAG: hypothetical protein GX301_12940 [Gracilibacteraceae bacterium]|jgi:hypothetical protein|nr:hypothetical protein [Gracilibacteraceae bacterium]